MARTDSTNHGFSRPGLTTDTFDHTLDYLERIDRLDAALRGLAAYHSDGGNYINADANNAGKFLSAVGDSYRGRVIAATGATDAQLIFQDSTGSGTGTDKYSIGYDDSRDSFAMSQGTTLGANGAEITAAGNFNVLSELEHASARLQAFILEIRNNAGTIEHRIVSAASKDTTADPGDVAGYADKINGASNSWSTMQLALGSTVGFTAGAGVMSGNADTIAFDTAAQTSFSVARISFTVSTNSTGTAITVLPRYNNTNINGVTRIRLACALKDASSGADFNVNTTNIPSGALLRLSFLGFIE